MSNSAQVTIGSKFGRLLVEAPAKRQGGHDYWRCVCDCGNISIVMASSLTTNRTKSCGCLANELKRRYTDHTGKLYGRLTVLHLDAAKTAIDRYHMKHWVCKCECGTVKTVAAAALTSGRTKSCGCLAMEKANKGVVEGGQEPKNPIDVLKSRHSHMLQRCYNAESPQYASYGGRGIGVSPDMLEFRDYLDGFLSKFGSVVIPEGLSLDRIDNNGDYSWDNLRLATRSQQARNTRRAKLVVTESGLRPLIDLCEEYGLSYSLVYNRLKLGIPIEIALTYPSRGLPKKPRMRVESR